MAVYFDGKLPPDNRRGQLPGDDELRWLEAIEDTGVNLTVKEQDFIESIGPQVRLGRRLSDAQLEWLEAIYVNRTP